MITKEIALTVHSFFHVTLRNADGTAVRCRANGKCQTWKTRSDDFRLPVKYGLKQYFDITPWNAHEWLTYDPTECPTAFQEMTEAKKALEVGLRADAPEWMVRDKRLEMGLQP